jgi:uncharacterized protein (TIGR03435 family)
MTESRSTKFELHIVKLFLLAVIGIVIVGVPVVFYVQAAPPKAQSTTGQAPTTKSPTLQWQIDAGGKMAFDVASVKQNRSGDMPSSNFPLGPGAVYSPNGGLFSATNQPLIVYIRFAYMVTAYQLQVLQPEVPKWVNADRFDIQARVQGNPTKDQMRLMMQALLADRFKLTIHNETRQLPVLAVVLVKPGKTGPQLQPHSEAASPCSTTTAIPQAPGSAPPVAGGLPASCGGTLVMPASVPGRVRWGARNATMGYIANSFNGMVPSDRPMLDRTGLTGNFDFLLEFTPELSGPLPPGPTLQPDPNGPPFLEALRDQLGLKLESQTGPVDVLVIDHVEEPSAN